MSTILVSGHQNPDNDAIMSAVMFAQLKNALNMMALLPGVFNINEPVIYGYPVVYNVPLMVPFVGCVAVNIIVSYLATLSGVIAPCVIQVPWTTPLFLNSFLATGGDIAAVVLQAILLVVDVLLYLPFMKVSEKALMRQAELEGEGA